MNIMKLRIAPRAGRSGALIGTVAALATGATALAATPVSGGSYRGSTSDGGRVAMRVVAGGARVHWDVAYRRTDNCQPPSLHARRGAAYDHNYGARIGGDGSYRETVASTTNSTFNGHPGYKVRVRARFSGRFFTRHRARGALEERETYYRPNGSQLATCVRHLSYLALLR